MTQATASLSLQEDPVDFIRDLNLLALGSRLRRVSDRIMAAGSDVYRLREIPFNPRWFPVYRVLADHGPLSVGETANALGLTHAAVSQHASALKKRGVVSSCKDQRDERRTVLSLSDEGRELLSTLRPVWDDLEEALREIVDFAGIDILAALDGIEDALAVESLSDRTERLSRRRQLTEAEIVDFAPGLREHFKTLNLEWLEAHFSVEPVDEEVLSNPERVILEPGGFIFFARIGEEIVGTCALLKQGARFELTKMAVTERFRGRQAGKKLMLHALEVARRERASSVFLVTNSSLKPAISLYRKVGFRVTQAGPHPKYGRGDLTMELDLEQES
jgi:DNA-binding MarR family transcriptional regulator/GNAT superfamily N-acetyltransferase